MRSVRLIVSERFPTGDINLTQSSLKNDNRLLGEFLASVLPMINLPGFKFPV
jgi:hypothetical protein